MLINNKKSEERKKKMNRVLDICGKVSNLPNTDNGSLEKKRKDKGQKENLKTE